MAFEGHAWRMPTMKFRKNPSNASPNTSQNVPCSPTKLTINYSPIVTTITSSVAHWWRMWGIKFKENPSNSIQNTTAKLLSPPTKCPQLLIDRNNNCVVVAHMWAVRSMKFQENPPIEAAIQSERLLLLQVLSILDRRQQNLLLL